MEAQSETLSRSSAQEPHSSLGRVVPQQLDDQC